MDPTLGCFSSVLPEKVNWVGPVEGPGDVPATAVAAGTTAGLDPGVAAPSADAGVGTVVGTDGADPAVCVGTAAAVGKAVAVG